MKLSGSPMTSAAIRARKATAIAGLVCRFFCGGIFLLAACRPSPDIPPLPPKQPVPTTAPATNMVPIPEEFLSPSPVKSVLPRVVFATSDFQVTTQHGIRGIQAGEALNFLREEGGDYVVEYGGQEFQKNQSYFAATYVEPSRPDPTPFAGEPTPAAKPASPEPLLPDEPPLGGTVPADDPVLIAGEKKVDDLTDSIRALNRQIRSAQDELDMKRTSGGEKLSPQEIKNAARAIQKLKAKRDQLGGQLTEMGKP